MNLETKEMSIIESKSDKKDSGRRVFEKLNPENHVLEEKIFENDINTIFSEDKDKFIGEFVSENYKITRGYTNGNGRQLRLYYTKMEPIKGPKISTLCIVHGFGEHSGRFLDIAETFVKNSFVVHLIDLRGFGYSGGPRGCATIAELHLDVEVLLKQASRDLPLFLYGHSLGGMLILSLALRNPELNLAGVITTSALIKFPRDRTLPAHKVFMIRLIGKSLEDVVVNSLINPTALTKNNYHIKKALGDRLMIPFLGMNMAKNIIECTEYLIPHAHDFKFPCLIIHGAQDVVTSHDDSIEFYNLSTSTDKSLKIFENGYHELQHDEEVDRLKETVLDWCLKRVEKSKPFGVFTKLRYGYVAPPLVSKKTIIYLCILLIYLITAKMLFYFYFLDKNIFFLSLKKHPHYSGAKALLFPLMFLVNLVKK